MATKWKLKLDIADIEHKLALDSDSDDYYEPCETEDDEQIEQQHEQESQPGTSAGRDSNWEPP